MKVEISLPPELVQAIAEEVVAKLKPLLKRPKEPDAMDREGLMSPPQLAGYLGVSKDWLYQRTSKNEIPFVKIGHHLKFRRSEIDRWLSTRSVPAVASLSAPLPGKRTWD